MKKSMILLATIALMATGGATVLAANEDAGQGTPANQYHMGFGQGRHQGMMGFENEEAHLEFMKEHHPELADMMDEELKAIIQDHAGRGMMRFNQTDQKAMQGMTEAERDNFMKERMTAHLEEMAKINKTIAAMTKEERAAFIQEHLDQRKEARANGSMHRGGRGFGMGNGNGKQHCLGN